MITLRAVTPEQKKDATDRILNAWLDVPNLRLGQFIENARSFYRNSAPMFYVEDMDLVDILETYARAQKDK